MLLGPGNGNTFGLLKIDIGNERFSYSVKPSNRKLAVNFHGPVVKSVGLNFPISGVKQIIVVELMTLQSCSHGNKKTMEEREKTMRRLQPWLPWLQVYQLSETVKLTAGHV
jgi:hypothetical protein